MKKKPVSAKQAFHRHRGFVMKGQFGSAYQNLRLLANQEYLTKDEMESMHIILFRLDRINENFDKNTRQLKAEKFGLSLPKGYEGPES